MSFKVNKTKTMSNSIIMRSFNCSFIDFMTDILSIFPENQDIRNGINSFELIKRVNPTIIIKVWYMNIYTPYHDIIQQGDISFFFEKDYTQDLTLLSNATDIMFIIDKIRDPIKTMSDENKKHTMKYIQILSELSNVYMRNKM